MMKHMIFHGIPAMNRPTPEQIERLQEQDSQIGAPVVREMQREVSQPVPQPISEPKPEPEVIQVTRTMQEKIDEDNRRHAIAIERHNEALIAHENLRREWSACISDPENVVCGHLHPGEKPSLSTYYP